MGFNELHAGLLQIGAKGGFGGRERQNARSPARCQPGGLKVAALGAATARNADATKRHAKFFRKANADNTLAPKLLAPVLTLE